MTAVGVFDSGIGGMSVLRHVRAQLPHENLIYLADAGAGLYGQMPEQQVVERAVKLAGFLVGQGAKALVVACNTATAAGIDVLRSSFPALPIIGIEPGLKPAAALSRNGRVGVLATERTLAGARFAALRDRISAAHGTRFAVRACAGWSAKVELGELDGDATHALVEQHLEPLLAHDVDTLVLGCTHYPFLRTAIETVLAGRQCAHIRLVDVSSAVARQLGLTLHTRGIAAQASGAAGSLVGYTSGDPAALLRSFERLLGLKPPVRRAALG